MSSAQCNLHHFSLRVIWSFLTTKSSLWDSCDAGGIVFNTFDEWHRQEEIQGILMQKKEFIWQGRNQCVIVAFVIYYVA